MKSIRLLFAGLGIFVLCSSCVSTEATDSTADHLLPEDFTVYVLDGKVINWPAPNTHSVKLPTRNMYRGTGGGYVACYSHQGGGSAYGAGGNIYVMGQVRVPGDYDGRIFQPAGYRGKDISAAAEFKEICAREITACRSGDCWGGGDTGGWFGIH